MSKLREVDPAILRQLLRYEPETGKLFWQLREPEHFDVSEHISQVSNCAKWNARYAGIEAFTSIDDGGYCKGTIFGVAHRAQRVIVAMMLGRWPAVKVDHGNGVRSDNRWCNLTEATNEENAKNCAIRSDNTSGVPGVAFFKQTQKWMAFVRKDGSTKHLGYFADFDGAVAARRQAERENGYHINNGRAQ
ncbi:HNH endonuclease signature motif containing protein [Cereibacter changlensis]|uniref:HNH endonuclease signature motif containing protein n=1 Tax=Cereibacter changlensis TaxID=402884 RepID=UPI004034921A